MCGAKTRNCCPPATRWRIAGPIWSLLHGVSMPTIGSDLSHVGIAKIPEALIERSLRKLLFHGQL